MHTHTHTHMPPVHIYTYSCMVNMARAHTSSRSLAPLEPTHQLTHLAVMRPFLHAHLLVSRLLHHPLSRHQRTLKSSKETSQLHLDWRRVLHQNHQQHLRTTWPALLWPALVENRQMRDQRKELMLKRSTRHPPPERRQMRNQHMELMRRKHR